MKGSSARLDASHRPKFRDKRKTRGKNVQERWSARKNFRSVGNATLSDAVSAPSDGNVIHLAAPLPIHVQAPHERHNAQSWNGVSAERDGERERENGVVLGTCRSRALHGEMETAETMESIQSPAGRNKVELDGLIIAHPARPVRS